MAVTINADTSSGLVMTPDTSGEIKLQSAGTDIATVTSSGITMASGKSVSGNPPQFTKLTSGTGTYTTPTGATYLVIEMVGAGGGGGGSNSAGASSAGGTGGTTTFGSSLLTCVGGAGGAYSGTNAGGTATVASPADGIGITGSAGASPSIGYNSSISYVTGGMGGCSPFGGAGQNQWATTSGQNGATNSGSGGGGGGGNVVGVVPGGGGASGGYIKAIITSPSSSYSYAIGSGGTAGTAGTDGYAGGTGGSGLIIVTAYFG